MHDEIAAIKASRIDPDRPAKLRRLAALRSEEELEAASLKASGQLDPAELRRIQQQSKTNVVAANRWTDNLWVIKKYLTKKKGMASKEVCILLLTLLLPSILE